MEAKKFLSRRDSLVKLALVGGSTALVTAGCTQQQVDDVSKIVGNIINQVQAGVVAACTAAGKLVPTANTVIGVLAAIVGSTNPALMTAAMIAEAIAEIVKVGCPSNRPTATPSGTTTKGVVVVFY